MSSYNNARAIVIQIIRWEERDDYTFGTYLADDGAEYDLVVAQPITATYHKDRPKRNPLDVFSRRIYKVEDTRIVENTVSMWVQRPHAFAKGDTVEIGMVRLGNPAEVVQ